MIPVVVRVQGWQKGFPSLEPRRKTFRLSLLYILKRRRIG
jgi:hypothetical protein